MVSLGKEHGYLQVHPSEASDRRSDREVILLLHGLGGSILDWRYPQSRGLHYERSTPADRQDDNNLGPPVDLPFLNLSLSDMNRDVRCWAGMLRGLGHTVVNYSQDGNQDRVDIPLAQLQNHIIPYIRDVILQDQLAGKRVVIICHSRGGILIRRYLAANAHEGSEWIREIITLATPHGATNAPLATSRIADIVNTVALVGGPEIALLARILTTKVFDLYEITDGALQLLPGNPLFDNLAIPSESPTIAFHTFGGSSVRFSGLYFWIYAESSYVPNFSDFPDVRYDWTSFANEFPIVSPLLDAVPSGILYDEQDEGNGDSCVTVASARLAGASNLTLPFNHAEALWDEALFALVADIVGTPLGNAQAIGCGPGIIGNTATRQFHDPLFENTNCQLREILSVQVFDTPDEARLEGYDGCFWCRQGDGPE